MIFKLASNGLYIYYFFCADNVKIHRGVMLFLIETSNYIPFDKIANDR